MIPGSSVLRQTPAWQRALAGAVRDPAELLALLGLDEAWLPGALAAARDFPLRVPRGFVARMRRGDPFDPLLRQVLPLATETARVAGYLNDPVADGEAAVAPGVLQKYEGRLLLTATGACAVHCRYCFRRHFPYEESNPAEEDWAGLRTALRADAGLREVILSGGDPLTLSDRRLRTLTDLLKEHCQVARLRLHTRLPVVLPERVDAGLLQWLRQVSLPVVMVIHANHANEIDDSVADALAALRATGVTLLNQSVLLRGVNDSVDALAALSEALARVGVMPYYLHLLDRVNGAAHFEVPEAEARGRMAELRARLPGYLVPRLVREVPGAPSKTPVA